MKPKIQMRIGLVGAVVFIIQSVHSLVDKGTALFLYSTFGVLFFLSLFVVYIFGIIEKDLKRTQIAYYCWLILTAVVIGTTFVRLVIAGARNWDNIFFGALIICGFKTFILWTGVQGLKRSLAAENTEV